MDPFLFYKFKAILKKYGFSVVLWCTWKYIRYGRGYFSHGISKKLNLSNVQDYDYSSWVKSVESKSIIRNVCDAEIKISIITPVYNVSPKWLDRCIESVLQQTYKNWELCIYDDCSTSIETRDCLKKWEGKDKRIKILFGKENLHIAGASNKALEIATGEYIALLDHDDELPRHALNEVVYQILRNKDLDFIYSDKDKIDENNSRFDPLFKPDWSPELMYSVNYLTHLNVIRTALVREIGGWDIHSNGAQDWDLFLRVTSRTNRIMHIPKILYHWRVHSMSTASSINVKPYARQAQEYSLNKHFKANGIAAIAKVSNIGHLSVHWNSNMVDDYFNHCAFVLFADSEREAMVFIKNNSETISEFKSSKKFVFLKANSDLLEYEGIRFILNSSDNFFEKLQAVCIDVGEYPIVFFNACIPLVSIAHVRGLLGWIGIDDSIGAVGCAIVDDGDRIQDVGMVFGLTSSFGNLFYGDRLGQATPFGHTNWVRNFNVVSTDLFVLSRNAVKSVSQTEEFVDLPDDELILFVMLLLRKKVFGMSIVRML